MTEQLNEFNTKKQRYLAEKQVLENLIKEKEKTINIIAALEQNLIEQATETKEKLNTDGFFSADYYVKLRQEESGIKTRIEYYNASKEEVEEKIYQQKEVLFNEYNHLMAIRKLLLIKEFNNLFEEFLGNEKETLNRLYLLLKYSRLPEETTGYSVKEILLSEIGKNIVTDLALDSDFVLPCFVQSEEIKTPAQKHKEKFEKPNKGLKKLIENLFS